MHPSANTAGGRRVTRWTRETIIEKILEWNVRYGEPPCSADWNPSLARWRAQEWRIERYQEGIWPSTNAAKRPFGGSFDAAVRAAGLEPHRSGPRRRPAGVARPAVEQREPQVPRSVDDALLDAADRVRVMERRVASLERELAVAERRAERAEDLLGDARVRARRAGERVRRAQNARERVQVVEREAGEQVELLTADANARVRAAYDQAQAAVADTREARLAARAAEARAADAEARAETAERLLGAAEAASVAMAGRLRSAQARVSLSEAGVSAAVESAVVSEALEAARVAEAQAVANAAAVAEAMAAVRAAETRAAAAEKRARELATLVCGEPRQLTRDELARLRDAGPTGPAVMANALRTLHKARAAGDRRGLTDALGDVASAAVGWRDRL
jgi:hypothetical protein